MAYTAVRPLEQQLLVLGSCRRAGRGLEGAVHFEDGCVAWEACHGDASQGFSALAVEGLREMSGQFF